MLVIIGVRPPKTAMRIVVILRLRVYSVTGDIMSPNDNKPKVCIMKMAGENNIMA